MLGPSGFRPSLLPCILLHPRQLPWLRSLGATLRLLCLQRRSVSTLHWLEHTASEYAHALGLPVAVLHKQRESGSVTRVTHLVGEVRDRPCLIIDDMISTGGTIAEGVLTLLEAGARPAITVAATHGLLLEGARERLAHPAIHG
jgi:hypothetical protein